MYLLRTETSMHVIAEINEVMFLLAKHAQSWAAVVQLPSRRPLFSAILFVAYRN
jgi:hypothetical protein